MITFLLIATITFGLLTLIWRNDGFNLVLRFFFGVMTVWGIGLIINNPSLFAVT